MNLRVLAAVATIGAAVGLLLGSYLLVAFTDISADGLVSFFIYGSAVPVFLFPAIYFALAPWWKSWTGRWLMMQSASLASVMALIVGATVDDDYPFRPQIRIVVYGLLFVAFCLGCAVLAYQQIAGRHARHKL